MTGLDGCTIASYAISPRNVTDEKVSARTVRLVAVGDDLGGHSGLKYQS